MTPELICMSGDAIVVMATVIGFFRLRGDMLYAMSIRDIQ